MLAELEKKIDLMQIDDDDVESFRDVICDAALEDNGSSKLVLAVFPSSVVDPEEKAPTNDELNSQLLYSEPTGLNIDTGLPEIDKNKFKEGVYY